MNPICIYHGNCADGFGAAWAVRKALGSDVDFHAGVYQSPPPDVTGRHVIMVDFSYKRDVLLELARKSLGVLLIDHHKTAIEDLKADANYIVDLDTYTGDVTWQRFLDNCYQDSCEGAPYGRVYAQFDLERSGAGMAWDFFHDATRPALIDHIEDRDLWRFKLPKTREIQANVFSYPYDFVVWDYLMSEDPAKLAAEGAAIERKHHKDVAELVGVVTRDMRIGAHVVPMANLPYTLTSDAGHLLCGSVDAPPGVGSPSMSRYPFAGCYWDTPEGRVFSLRSRDDGLDVGEIAKQYGGGGHKHASGFRVPFDQLAQFEP